MSGRCTVTLDHEITTTEHITEVEEIISTKTKTPLTTLIAQSWILLRTEKEVEPTTNVVDPIL